MGRVAHLTPGYVARDLQSLIDEALVEASERSVFHFLAVLTCALKDQFSG